MLDGLRRRHASRSSPRPLSLNFSTFSAPPPSPDMDSSSGHPFRRTLHRLKLMSSPSLSELGKSEKSSPDDRGEKQKRAGANATWNSIHNAVIAVFQKKGLADNELYTLNEGVRHLLKTELGSFFSEYLQNQLLTKGMVILRDKIRYYEGQKLLDSLAETWDFFFCDVLSMLQAIFHPVQGKEPSVRQLALLHFRNTIVLSVKLEDALSRPRARVPPSVTQMLLILQGVHEPRGVNEDYLRLESLVQKVVSPYLGTHGLYSGQEDDDHCCVFDKRVPWGWPKSADQPSKNPVVRSKSYNIPLLLTPVAEYDPDPSSVSSGGIRRHSACEIISCLEEQGRTYSDLTPGSELSGPSSSRLCVGSQFNGIVQAGATAMDLALSSPSILHSSGALHGTEATTTVTDFSKGASSSPPSESSSPETVIGQIPESAGSDSDGIFIEFPVHSLGVIRKQTNPPGKLAARQKTVFLRRDQSATFAALFSPIFSLSLRMNLARRPLPR
ncbi:Proline-rich protein 5 [Characodon lateralis]|uniref:Proline-rich protein 5 n=1 Tax=Characodon lateralis TaxID=208331 RepID=A0ABU7CR00_9TELE|nr:Proline-rich protein 5 [Characodon lateralis]